MTAAVAAPQIRAALAGIVERVAACEEELNALDAELGDGDLGSTLASVARAVQPIVAGLPPDIGAAMSGLAGKMAGVSGSSFSGLIIIALRRAARAAAGKTEISRSDFQDILKQCLAVMVERGGARLGDKTMLDCLAAIANAAPEADFEATIAETLDQFRPQPCRGGRARLAGERSIGRDDPGMVAIMRIVEGAVRGPA